jgi:cell division protein FtsA
LSRIIVGLEIGTSCIRCVIGQINEDDHLEIIGAAKRPSNKGLQKGVIVNIGAAMSAIKETIDDASVMAGVDVHSVYVAIGGVHVEGRCRSGGIPVDTTNRNRRLEISNENKKHAIDSAIAVFLPMDKQILHAIPQEYKIDEISGYKDPIGNLGVRLDVSVFLVTASKTACATIGECLSRAGLDVDGIYLKTLAEAEATLNTEEMELGSILIDIGADSTDAMVIYNGAPIYITSVPVGGNLVTSDIAQVKGIPRSVAEEIKIQYGCCWIEGNEAEEEVIIREIGSRPAELTTRYDLCAIIQPRMAEIMTMIRREIVKHSGLKELSGSIVVTGGGALMPGVRNLTQSIWGTESVRLGECADYGRLPGDAGFMYRKADFATAVGLGVSVKNSEKKQSKTVNSKRESSGEKIGFVDKVKEIWQKFF